MSSIVKSKSGNNIYLYESVSFRKDGKPRSKRKIVGKVDNATGNYIYKQEYIERMKAAGTPVVALKKQNEFSYSEIKSSVIKELGAFDFYKKIAEKIGLLKILQDVFIDKWQEIFDIACYLTSSGDPLMYCQKWVDKTDCFPLDLDSRRISELLKELTHNERENFYSAWCAYRSEREYLALDITSISSYSQRIDSVEYGYNRDGEKLPQINLSMLLGEKSRLPVYQHLYSGSIKDVSTLVSSLKMISSMGKRKLTLVMDKGFFSKNNIKTLLEKQFCEKFLIAVPFTLKKTKSLISELRETIDSAKYAIGLSKTESIQGVCREIEWDDNQKVYAHVFYNMIKAGQDKNALYAYVAYLVEKAKKDPNDKKLIDEFNKYLIIKKHNKNQNIITIKQNVLDEEISHAGWMVLISNSIKDAKKALSIYRSKDAVEKGFYRLKNNLDLKRIRVHSDEVMEGKLFLGFISLILMSHIHQVMTVKKMYRRVSLIEVVKELEKLRVQYISGNKILFPLTKFQKEIFEIFGLEIPM